MKFKPLLTLSLALLGLLLIASGIKAQSESAGQAQPAEQATSQKIDVKIEFHVRYINENEVYVDAGRDAGLTEGAHLELRKPFKSIEPANQSANAKSDSSANSGNPATAQSTVPLAADFQKTEDDFVLAHLTVVGVANTSSVCEVNDTKRPLVPGDLLTLAQADVQKLVDKQALGNTRVFPMIVSFTAGDPLDEEIREAVPQQPLPEINQVRGRIGFDMSQIQGLGANGFNSNSLGLVLRMDATRIRGTHWNLLGYWRGTVQHSSANTASTLQDLINRTYQMSLTYVNPQAHWTAGIGRLYLPWATSLEAIDGGYYAHYLSHTTIAGVFAGSTPDPTAWNYNPKNKMGGLFLNVHGGDFDSFRYSSTFGGGVRLVDWSVNKPFGFTENDLSYKRVFTLYHSMQIDQPTANPGMPAVSMGLGQSLLSMRVAAGSRVSLDLTHTYFRDVPTYDPILVGTGLLDKYLFQGISGGARIELPRHITTYFTVGESNASTDSKNSSNYMYGASINHIWKTGMNVDARISRFNSVFAAGNYKTLTLSRDLNDRFRVYLQGGKWSYSGATLTANTGSWFTNCTLETNLGPHYFFESSFSSQRGGTQDYNQWISTFGYRFDNRAKTRMNTLAQQH